MILNGIIIPYFNLKYSNLRIGKLNASRLFRRHYDRNEVGLERETFTLDISWEISGDIIEVLLSWEDDTLPLGMIRDRSQTLRAALSERAFQCPLCRLYSKEIYMPYTRMTGFACKECNDPEFSKLANRNFKQEKAIQVLLARIEKEYGLEPEKKSEEKKPRKKYKNKTEIIGPDPWWLDQGYT